MNLLKQFQEKTKRYYLDNNLPTENKKFEVMQVTNSTNDLFLFKYINGISDWSNDIVKMSRGIVLNENGQIVVRPYDKFFNYHQYLWMLNVDSEDSKKFSNISDVQKVVAMTVWPEHYDRVIVADKLDGSLMNVSFYQNDYITTSSGSIDGIYPNLFRKDLDELINTESQELKSLLKDKTLVCEYINSKVDSHVVKYSEKSIVAHGLIYNETGLEVPFAEMVELLAPFGFKFPKVYDVSTEEDVLSLLNELENEEVEGVVVSFETNGQPTFRLKFKTESYIAKHGMQWTLTKDIYSLKSSLKLVELILEDELDDFMSEMELSSESLNHLSALKEIEAAITKAIETVSELSLKNLTNKEIATSEYAPLVKSLYFRQQKSETPIKATDSFFETFITKEVQNLLRSYKGE